MIFGGGNRVVDDCSAILEALSGIEPQGYGEDQ
ncbi:hypothetical protein BBR47_56540 [Brevibacillus brevis NBRC 100599]|uniref:Uncharacterized protein n=1 Tax=Brevibacillus brevis (strain 47 / JCM 6285 / NBRC 100599) TaxID=358681 RepID=C0Z8K4_BREBN|nr:hypothetical protein BBR47_56540 [Brevibacillus brevis NBRC 100599]